MSAIEISWSAGVYYSQAVVLLLLRELETSATCLDAHLLIATYDES